MNEIDNAVVEDTKIWETFSRDQIEQIIQGNIRSVDEKMGQMMELFITSGYYLRRQYNEKMYQEAGYDRFEDYVKDRYGKSRSWATRMMQINEQYSIGGNDPRIDPKYKLYGVSQLQEMLYLTDEQREQASPDMTVKEIRALKTPEPVEEEQLPGQMCVEDYPEVMPEPEIDFKALDKMIGVATSQKEECCESVAEPEPLPTESITTGTIELPDEVIDAEYTEITEEITPQSLLVEAKKWLEDYIKCDAPKNLIEKQKIYVGALANIVCDLEGVTKPEPPVQPDLPVMKNNDQRKEWLRDYKAWGVWYYDDHIDVYYYKYDFDNGDRLIVAEYPNRGAYWYGPGASYTEKHYHLLEAKRQCHSGGTYNHKFTHAPDSETYLVDYLKRVTKG